MNPYSDEMNPLLTEGPIMVRADITRDELKAIKRIALDENKTSQALLGELVRERIAKENT